MQPNNGTEVFLTMIGRLYCWPHDPRQFKVRITAEYCNKQVKVIEENCLDPASQFSKLFAKGQKVPAFIDDINKVTVLESSGIAYHIAKLNDSSNSLLGKTKLEESQIAQWMFYSDTNIWSNSFSIATMYYGYNKHDKKSELEKLTQLKKCLTFLDKHLLHHTFFAAERVTFADILLSTSLAWVYSQYFEEADRREYPNVLRWFNTCVNQPQFKKHYGDFKLCEKRAPVLTTPPKAAVDTPKKEAKKEVKKAAKAPAEEAKSVVEKKVKHPCEELLATTLNLDAWKREYSNNETRDALKWFWSNFDSNGYSVWHVQYKYNNELTKTFMSSNLIGGFFQRIERARKYAFGSILVTGVDNDNKIEGFFVFRGQEVLPEIEDAPDYASFTFDKVNVLDAKWKGKFEDALAWEGPSITKFADGKVFK